MRVLLTTVNSKYIHQNLAIRLLYELNKNFEGLFIQEFNTRDRLDEMAVFCSKFNIVAFSCYIWNISITLELAREIKKLHPECKILLGGPEVSYEWQDIIELPEVDFIIPGEGEVPFSSFLQLYPSINNISGLIRKEQGIVLETKTNVVPSLDILHHLNPYSGIPDEEIKNKICYIEASRGCPNCCEFCLAGQENGIRYLPVDTVKNNLLYLIEKGKIIKFLDRTFNANPSHAVTIFKFILEHYKPGNLFQFEIKADTLSSDFIEFIKTNVPNGLFRFEIGIQTLNVKSNKAVKRIQNYERIKTIVQELSGKIEIHLDLIVGLPHDFLADIKYTFEEVFKLFAPELQLGFLKFLKGTPLRLHYKIHAYIFDPLPPYQIMESKYLSRSEIVELQYLEEELEIFWNKKRAIYTLRYIALNDSIFNFLLGLGKYRKYRPDLNYAELSNQYQLLFEFSTIYDAHNRIIQELIVLDYYLQYKVKPGSRFLDEVERKEKNEIIRKYNLNHHKYRYAIHWVHFSIDVLMKEQRIEPVIDLLVIEFSGITSPRIIQLL